MSKLFSSIVFSFFLLFQTTAIAEEDSPPLETSAQEQELQEPEVAEETESIETQAEQESQTEVMEEAVKEVQEEVEPEEVLSEAEKEALAAEAAELREAGLYEEPVVE